MLITSIAPYSYTNRYNTNLNNRYQGQNINFTSRKFISSDAFHKLEPIALSCKEILSSLERKNAVGIQKIGAEIPDLEFVDGNLILKNFGKDKKALKLGFLDEIKQYFRISLADEQTENNYIINLTLGRLEKSVNGVSTVPRSSLDSANNDFEKFLPEAIEETDFRLLKLRRHLEKVKNEDLIVSGSLDVRTVKTLQSALKKYEDIEQILSGKNNSAALKLKREFGNYNLVAAQSAHEFTNVGPQNLTVCFAPIKSQRYHNLKRMVVSNHEGEIIDAYLIKDNDKLVSNFNKKYPSYIPDKLKFYSKEELESGISAKFEKYLIEIDKMLLSFKTFLLEPRARIAKLIDGQHKEFLSGAIELYPQISNKLDKLNPNHRGILKKSCPLIEAKDGRAGFTFVNINSAGEKLSFLPIKNSHHQNLTKLTVLSSDDKVQKIFLLQNDDKLIANFNPKYPNVVPPVLKVATDEELVASGLFEYLEPLQKSMISLKDYIIENVDVAAEMKLAKQREYNSTYAQKHAGRVVQPKKVLNSFQRDVRAIRTQSLEQLKEAFKEFEKSHNSEYLFNILNRIKTDIIKISNDN